MNVVQTRDGASRQRRGRSWAAALAVALVAGSGLVARAASAQVAWPTAALSGYSTGTVDHADALQAGASGPQLSNAEVAFSGASVSSTGASSAAIANEMGQVVQPALPDTKSSPKLAGAHSFARGSGLEVGP